MPSKDALIKELMVRYARHEKLTDKEMRLLEEFWSQSPEHQQLAEQFADEEWVKRELAKMEPAPIEEIWEGINRYLDEIGAPDDRGTVVEWDSEAEWDEKPSGGWITKLVRPLSIAAALALCAWGVWVLVGKDQSGATRAAAPAGMVAGTIAPKDDQVLLVYNDGRTVEMNADMRDIVGWQRVLVGAHRGPYVIHLTGGTNIWLHGGARLENAAEKTGSYTLAGMAYFEVVHDPSQPFRVSVNGGFIEDIGTTFNIETNEQESHVQLLSGKVRVGNGAGSKVLKPAQEAVLAAGKVEVRLMQDAAAATGWVQQALNFHFKDTEFTDAVAAVASWYGYTISNPKGLKGTPITDDLQKDPAPEGLVYTISQEEPANIHMWVEGKTIFISDSAQPVSPPPSASPAPPRK